MKELKAFVHRGRAADIVHALLVAGFNELSVNDVKGTIKALSAAETSYSVEFGEGLVTESKIEVVCDEADVDRAIEIFRSNARTGRASGWIYISEIERAIRLES